jgi:hypothetical protein
MEKFPGTKISREDIESGKILFEEYDPKLKYKWSCGIALTKYLEGLKEGKLLGRKCNTCKRIMIPPRMFCEICFKPTTEWVELKDTGKINTFSKSYITSEVVRLEKPIIPAVIEIDGASKGMGILHLIGGVDPDKVKIGMKVKAVWKEPSERKGAITDIIYFKPVG